MERRGFLSGLMGILTFGLLGNKVHGAQLGVGTAYVGLPTVVKEWEFEGAKVIEFLYPKSMDSFLVSPNNQSIWMPMIDLRIPPSFTELIKGCRDALTEKTPFIHVIRIDGYPNMVGIMGNPERYAPPPCDMYAGRQSLLDYNLKLYNQRNG